jgi:predicted DNA-binding transcriptional regulator AlpA
MGKVKQAEKAQPVSSVVAPHDLSRHPAVLSTEATAKFIGVSLATLYRMIGVPCLRFPQPIKLSGTRKNAFLVAEVIDWLESKAPRGVNGPICIRKAA